MTPSPVAFVRGKDSHLWMNWQPNILDWKWTDLKGTVDEAVGVVVLNDTPDGSRPYVFVRRDDHLWSCWWNEKQWNWTDQNTYGGPSLLPGGCMGAVTVTLSAKAGPQPFAVVQGKDRNAWVNWWDSLGMKWRWLDMGQPPETAIALKVGVVTVVDPETGNERPHTYVRSTDGNLWMCVPDSEMTRATWTNLGVPPYPALITGTIGPLAVPNADHKNTQAIVFVTSNVDGHIWVNSSEGTDSRWTDIGAPRDGLNTPLGPALIQTLVKGKFNPAALVTDNERNLWSDELFGTWNLLPHGNPTNDVVVEQFGWSLVLYAPENTRTHVFLRTREGLVYDNWYG
jgi:hypothetical protein